MNRPPPEEPSPPAAPPRLSPGRPFPAYAYYGAPQPHPLHDPAGHSHGTAPRRPDPLDPGRWQESEEYLHGIDLFNHGYYWEAHDAWEALWVAAGKRGAVSEFLKGLIKLTAAGVKARQGVPEGVRRHAENAEAHFREAARAFDADRCAGFSLAALAEYARQVGGSAADFPRPPGDAPAFLFARYLLPHQG